VEAVFCEQGDELWNCIKAHCCLWLVKRLSAVFERLYNMEFNRFFIHALSDEVGINVALQQVRAVGRFPQSCVKLSKCNCVWI